MQDKNKKWFVVVSFKTELLSECLIQDGYRQMGPLLGIDFSFKNRKNVDNDICHVDEEQKEFQSLVKNDYQKLIPIFLNVVEKRSKDFIEFGRKINLDKIKKIPNIDLANIFKEYCTFYKKAAGLIGVPVPCEFAMLDVIKEKLKYYLKDKNLTLEQFMQIISFSDNETKTYQERIDLFELATRRNKGEEVTGSIEEHSRKYGWILKTLFLGEDYNTEKIRGELKKQSNPQERIAEIKDNRYRQMNDFKNIIHGIPKEVREDISLFRELIFFRNSRLEWLNEGCYNGKALLSEIAKRLGLTFDELIYLMPLEIEAWLMGKSKVSKEEIENRVNKYALVMEDDKIALYTGDDVEKHKVKVEIIEKDEFKGQCASQGRAKGFVKIVKDRSELNKVDEGDILVARLTTPDFILAMEKAAALVTDIGGLTSHAAIVSRELGVPCIVGTEIATKILKDGDLVEVDAEKGIVRRINEDGK